MGKIPKNIFVYWHEEKMPNVIYKMYQNIKSKNKDFKIYKFNDKILKEKIKNIPDSVLQAYKLYRVENGIENWFIASPPKTELLKNWLKESVIAFEDKKKYHEKNGRYDTNNEINLPHLAQHLAFIKVIYENDLSNDYKLLGDLYLEKFNHLPFHYHFKFKWNSYKLAEFLLNSKNINKEIKFIKLRGSDRKYFIRLYNKTKYSKNSFIIRLLGL